MRLGLSLGQRVAPGYEAVGVKKVESRSDWEEVELSVPCSFLLGRFRGLRGLVCPPLQDVYPGGSGLRTSVGWQSVVLGPTPCVSRSSPIFTAGGFSFPKGLELARAHQNTLIWGRCTYQRAALAINLLQPRATWRERTSTQEFSSSDGPVCMSLGAVFGLLIDMGRPRSLLGSITPGPVVLGWVPWLNVRLGANK